MDAAAKPRSRRRRLIDAVGGGAYGEALRLLDEGVNPNTRTKSGEDAGLTPLHVLLEHGNIFYEDLPDEPDAMRLLETLILKGADLDAKSTTPRRYLARDTFFDGFNRPEETVKVGVTVRDFLLSRRYQLMSGFWYGDNDEYVEELLLKFVARRAWNRIRRITPLVGAFAIWMHATYADVSARPPNGQAYMQACKRFKSIQ